MMATNDPKEVPTAAARYLGWVRAISDCEPLMIYTKANTRLIQAEDVGRTVSEIIFELLQQRGDEIKFDDEITFDDDDTG